MRLQDLGGSLEANYSFHRRTFYCFSQRTHYLQRLGRQRSFPHGLDQVLIVLDEVNRVALTDDAFYEDGGVDSGHPATRGRHMAQNARFSFARLGVDRDHLAARITLEDR
jgi:hypothetical protein